MSQQNKNLGSENIPRPDADHASISDLRNLVVKQHEDYMSAIRELRGTVVHLFQMMLGCDMERLSIGMERDIIEIKPHSSAPRRLKLVFNNKISLPVRNGEELRGEGGKYLEVALVDDGTGKVVKSGQEASARVEIVALEGDSDDCESDTWVIGNYKKKIGGVSEAKRSVLVGKLKLKLNEGIGSLVNIKFRNSSRHNCGVFKLGAKVIDSFDGTVVKEAMTESFGVQDFRGKYREKHEVPSLSDEVWRLVHIRKGGNIDKRLGQELKVKTVEDFLIQLLKDSAGLKSTLSLPEKKWNDIVNHAKRCTINQTMYCGINSRENKGVVFNVVGQVLGLITDWHYVPYERLSQENKLDASKLFAALFEFKEEVKYFDDESSFRQYLSHQSTAVSANSPRLGNTVSHEVETSKSGEFDQANINASSRDVSSSKNPDEGTISQEDGASGLDKFPSDNPPGCTGLQAPLNGPICVDQYNVVGTNLSPSSKDVLSSENHGGGTVSQIAGASVCDELDLDIIFPPTSSSRGTGLEGPLYSPYSDDQKYFDTSLLEALLSSSSIQGDVSNEVEASDGSAGVENFGLKYTEIRTKSLLSSPEQYPQSVPLSPEHYNVRPSYSSLNLGKRQRVS